MSTIAETIAQWRSKQISGLALMRALVGYEQWNIPIPEAAAEEILATHAVSRLQTTKIQDGTVCLLLFSGGDAYKVYSKAAGVTSGQHVLTTGGTWVFRLELDGVDQVHIDPLSPYDVFYTKDQFVRLREMAEAVEIEKTLLSLRQGTAPDGSVRAVREYKNYYLAVATHEGRPRILMAPDERGRALAAVFTADDAFDAFAPDAKAQVGDSPVQQLQMDGSKLFGTLGRMQFDGIVFNCAGPVVPVAFAAGLSQVVLEA